MTYKTRLLIDTILRDSPFAWWEWDVTANRVTFNDLKVTMLGYRVEDFAEKGFEVFTGLLHPDDHKKTMDAMRAVLSGARAIYQVDYRIKDSAGQYRWYMDRGAVLSREGSTVTRLRGLVVDLGDERRHGTDVEALVHLLQRYAEGHDNAIGICSSCKRIRLSKDEWTTVTEELEGILTDALSHGLCPSCIRTLYPDMAEKILARMR